MKKPIGHIRANAIAYLALFVALGGTGYAAVSIPRNSVGTAQLRNGAVTAGKLNSRSIAGSVVFWAQIAQDGKVIRSSEPASTSGWSSGNGFVMFRAPLSQRCFALGNVLAIDATGSVSLFAGASIAGQEKVNVFMTPAGNGQLGPLPIDLAVICPS
jgi:hypothetical protein